MKKNNKGFSLVELIVVVLIMAIIATALTLAVTKYIAKSKRSADANTAGELITAIQTAVTDYETTEGTLTGKTIKVTTTQATWIDDESTTTSGSTAVSQKVREFMQKSASSVGVALMSKVYPKEGFIVTAKIEGSDDATYTVTYSGHTDINPVLAASN